MNESAKQTAAYALLGTVVLAYFARPWSCGFALSQYTTEDPVTYANFDYHGLVVSFAWLSALLFAAPLFWLAAKICLNAPSKPKMFGRARDAKSTIVSLLIALGIGMPMFAQFAYLAGLPFDVNWPVWVSALAWLLIVEMFRTAAVTGGSLGKGGVRLAAAVAAITTLPKLIIIGGGVLSIWSV